MLQHFMHLLNDYLFDTFQLLNGEIDVFKGMLHGILLVFIVLLACSIRFQKLVLLQDISHHSFVFVALGILDDAQSLLSFINGGSYGLDLFQRPVHQADAALIRLLALILAYLSHHGIIVQALLVCAEERYIVEYLLLKDANTLQKHEVLLELAQLLHLLLLFLDLLLQLLGRFRGE